MKLLMAIREKDVAPRFDLATEVLIADCQASTLVREPKMILLPRPSGDEICSLVVRDEIGLVICGGIEDAHYQYLVWKKVTVIDGVIGPCAIALQQALEDCLAPGAILPGVATTVNDLPEPDHGGER